MEKEGDNYALLQDFAKAHTSYRKAEETARKLNFFPYAARLRNKRIEQLIYHEEYALADSLARTNYRECIKTQGQTLTEAAEALMYIGVLSSLTGNGRMFFEYLRRSLEMFEKTGMPNRVNISKACAWLGCLHESHGDSALAHYYLKKASRMFPEKAGYSQSTKADILRYTGLFYKRYKRPDSAAYFFRKAKSIFDLLYGHGNLQSVKCMNNLADLYCDRHDYVSAQKIYDSCFLLNRMRTAPSRYAEMMTLYNQGEAFLALKQFRKAALNVQKILHLYCPGVISSRIESNPAPEELIPNFALKLALVFKATIIQEWFRHDGGKDLTLLTIADEVNERVEQLIDRNRERIISFDNLLHHQQYYASVFYGLAEQALDLFEATGDTVYLSRAITRFEKNRNARKLLGSQIHARYGSRADANNSHYSRQLQKKITALQSQIGSAPPGILKSLSDRLDVLKTELDMEYWLLLQNNSKSFHPLYDFKPEFLTTIQNELSRKQLLLFYFEDINDITSRLHKLILIALTREGARVIKIQDGKRLEKHIQDFCTGIREKHPVREILENGTTLTNLLLPEQIVFGKYAEIIVIPSVYTGRIPFEALPLPGFPSTEYHPVIERHTLWMCPSTELLTKPVPATKTPRLLAVAPDFSGKKSAESGDSIPLRSDLLTIPLAAEECREISRWFPTVLHTGKGATRDAFIKECQSKDILHISTHGVSPEGHPQWIALAFPHTDSSRQTNSHLDFWDVTRIPLKANLVVLSACKTAEGKDNGGEGRVNLATAFLAAGAGSAVVNLWDANEYASYQMMTNFYRYLSEGIGKPEALRKAKLDYLKISDEMMGHPYYWAGMGYYGGLQHKLLLPNNSLTPIKIPGIFLLLSVTIAFLLKNKMHYS